MPHRITTSGFAFLLLLAPMLAGCQRWRTVRQPVPEAAREHSGEWVRVALQDGAYVEADSIDLRGDALVVWHKYGTKGPREYSLSEVVTIQVRDLDMGKTLLLGAAVPVAFVAIVFVASDGALPPP